MMSAKNLRERRGVGTDARGAAQSIRISPEPSGRSMAGIHFLTSFYRETLGNPVGRPAIAMGDSPLPGEPLPEETITVVNNSQQ